MSQSGFSKFAYGTEPVKRAFANVAAGSTDTQLVAAVAEKQIRITSFYFVCGATATNATFNTKDSGAGTAISPLIANAANGGAVCGHNPTGWHDTNEGEALTVTTGAGSATGIHVNYVEF